MKMFIYMMTEINTGRTLVQKHLRLPREKLYFKEIATMHGLFHLQLKTE